MKIFKIKVTWQALSLVAFIIMVAGFILSLWGISYDDPRLSLIGIMAIIGVCVSWWLWVVIIMTHLFDHFEDTIVNMVEIKRDITEVKELVKKADSFID